jgi:hypothetical protein
MTEIISAVIGVVLGAVITWGISVRQRHQKSRAEKKKRFLRLKGALHEAKTIFDESWGPVSQLEYNPADPVKRETVERVHRKERIHRRVDQERYRSRSVISR